jgi:signal peptidase I
MTDKKKAVSGSKKAHSSSQTKVKRKKEYIKREVEEKKKPKKVNRGPAKKKRKHTKHKSGSTNTSVHKNRRVPPKKKQQKPRKKKKLKLLLNQIILTIAISVGLFSTIIYFTVRTTKMEGYAMTTTLTDKDRVLISKLGQIKRFKMVYFKHSLTKEKTVRRIIGMPGDELYYKNDQLFINNKLTPERFLEKAVAEAKQSGFLLTQDFSLKQVADVERIPENKYFVLGDNRQFSSDSRDYGLIDKKDIIGIVELRFFPLPTAAHF